MTANLRWFQHLRFEEAKRRGGDALDLWAVNGPGATRMFCGTVVDAPSGAQFELSIRVRTLARDLSWDGTSRSIPELLEALAGRISSDDLALRTLHQPMNRGGVSIGGIAFCSRDEAVAFRLGRFRVLVGSKVALWEQSLLRAQVAAGAKVPHGAVQYLQGSLSVMPAARFRPEDFVQVSEAEKSVRVVHAAELSPLESVEDASISIAGVWRGA